MMYTCGVCLCRNRVKDEHIQMSIHLAIRANEVCHPIIKMAVVKKEEFAGLDHVWWDLFTIFEIHKLYHTPDTFCPIYARNSNMLGVVWMETVDQFVSFTVGTNCMNHQSRPIPHFHFVCE